MLWIAALFAAAIAAEAFVSWCLGRPAYDLRETELSLALATGALTLMFFLPAATHWAPRILHFTPLAVPTGLGGLLLLILAGDFLLYWSHRASHVWRWQWAAHEAHHSANRLNFLASFRQGWTDAPAGLWFYTLPLAFLGFSTAQWTAYFLISTAVQMFAHNEWAPKLGPAEWLLVTPSHHRVHHALEAGPQARNFANVLIVWDRLFGTFAAEGDAPVARFGVKDRTFRGVADIAFGTWRTMLRR